MTHQPAAAPPLCCTTQSAAQHSGGTPTHQQHSSRQCKHHGTMHQVCHPVITDASCFFTVLVSSVPQSTAAQEGQDSSIDEISHDVSFTPTLTCLSLARLSSYFSASLPSESRYTTWPGLLRPVRPMRCRAREGLPPLSQHTIRSTCRGWW